jgi:hypothetical protein
MTRCLGTILGKSEGEITKSCDVAQLKKKNNKKRFQGKIYKPGVNSVPSKPLTK